MSIPNLKFAPINQVKFPKRIFYGDGNRFNIASTTTGDILGTIKFTPTELKTDCLFGNTNPIKSLYINDLNVQPFARRTNVGRDCINFAKAISKKLGCEGRLHLLAYNYEEPAKAPHKFYRKLGFSTTSPQENKALDLAIKNNTNVPSDMCFGTTMFLA